MASSGTDGADDEKASSLKASLRPEDVDGGWSTSPPKAVEPVPEKPPTPPTEPDRPEPPPPLEADKSGPAVAVEVEAPAPPPPPPVEPSRPAEVPPVPEAAPALRPPPLPSRSRAEASAELTNEPSPPPLPVRSRAEPPPLAEPSPAFASESPRGAGALGAPPTKGWVFVGGVGMIVALFVGVMIGKSLDRPADRIAAPSASPPRTAAAPVKPAPAPAPAPPPAKAASAEVETPAPKAGGTALKHAPGPFNAQAAKLAIDKIVPKLKGCKQPGEPPGSATVTVTFAPTGRVSNAAVTTQRYAGTRTGNCIAQRLREAKIPEFTGKPVTVKRGIAVK